MSQLHFISDQIPNFFPLFLFGKKNTVWPLVHVHANVISTHHVTTIEWEESEFGQIGLTKQITK